MIQVDNKSLITHDVYLLPTPLGTKIHYCMVKSLYEFLFLLCEAEAERG